MKLQVLAVAVVSIFSAVGASSPVNMDGGATVAANPDPVVCEARDLQSSPDDDVEKRSIAKQLREFVHDTHVDFSAFSATEMELWPRISTLNSPTKLGWNSADVGTILSLFLDIQELDKIRGRFDRCYYRGLDLVEEVYALNIRLLALIPLKGEDMVSDVKSKLYYYANHFAVLKHRAENDPEFSGTTQGTFERKADLVALQIQRLAALTKDLDRVQELKSCPAVEGSII